MLDTLNNYLRIGIENGSADIPAWPLLIATALIAAAILRRQSGD